MSAFTAGPDDLDKRLPDPGMVLRLVCGCGRNLADVTRRDGPGMSLLAGRLVVLERPGNWLTRWPKDSDAAHPRWGSPTWSITCRKCRTVHQVRHDRLVALYGEEAAGRPQGRHVVRVTVGRDL